MSDIGINGIKGGDVFIPIHADMTPFKQTIATQIPQIIGQATTANIQNSVKKQITVLTQGIRAMRGIAHEVDRVAGGLFKAVVAPSLGIAILAVHKFLQSTDASANKLGASMHYLTNSFNQFLGRIGKILVDTYHLDVIFHKIGDFLNSLDTAKLKVLISGVIKLTLAFVALKLISGSIRLFSNWAEDYKNILKLTQAVRGLGAAQTLANLASGMPMAMPALPGAAGLLGTATTVVSIGSVAAGAAAVLGAAVSAGIVHWMIRQDTKSLGDAGAGKKIQAIYSAIRTLEALPIIGQLAGGSRKIAEWLTGKTLEGTLTGKNGNPLEWKGKAESTGGFVGLNKAFQDAYNNAQQNAPIKENSAETKHNSDVTVTLTSAVSHLAAVIAGGSGGGNGANTVARASTTPTVATQGGGNSPYAPSTMMSAGGGNKVVGGNAMSIPAKATETAPIFTGGNSFGGQSRANKHITPTTTKDRPSPDNEGTPEQGERARKMVGH